MKEKPEKKYRLGTSARIVKRGAMDDALMEFKGADHYERYDSSTESFDEFFKDVLAPYATIRDYVEAYYGVEKGVLVGVEYGGPARQLFEGLNSDKIFRKTVGFTLIDRRDEQEHAQDTLNDHDVVEADVFFKDGVGGLSWRTVEEWTKTNGKPDIAIERMVQGVDLIRRADLFVAILKRWLSQISDHGTLLAEIPKFMPQEERNKIPALLENVEVEEMVFSSDITKVLVRRSR